MRRIPRRLAILLVIGLAGAGVWMLSSLFVSAQRMGFRTLPPSCEQAIENLSLEGQPVSCEEPPPPTHDPPRMYGQYRLFPKSYVGPLTYEDSPDTAPPARRQESPSDGAGVDCFQPLRYSICEDRLGLFAR